MNKEVIISIIGNQSMDQNDTDRIELITEGKYYKKDDKYYITYKESEMTGFSDTTTTVKVEGDRVTLIRFGANNSQLVFEKGQRYVGHYDTPYGAFTIGVMPNNVLIDIDDSGGQINVNYSIEINNGSVGKNDFFMTIREAGKTNDKCC